MFDIKTIRIFVLAIRLRYSDNEYKIITETDRPKTNRTA